MADLSLVTFNADIQAFAKLINANLAIVIKKIAFDLYTRLILKTPVDTGRARAGWGISVNTPIIIQPTGYNNKAAKKVKGPEGADYEAAFHASGIFAMPDLSAIDGTQQVFILNSVEYIEALEDGHSKQAPAGMVKVSIAELELEITSLLAQNGL